MPSITTAEWSWESDYPVPRSEFYDDIYHSRSGGEEQAREVFLKGNGFPERWEEGKICTILETGFGLGINFLTTWNAWIAAGSKGRLHYLSIERYPFKKEDLQQILASFPSLKKETESLIKQWMIPVPGFHRLEFNEGKVVLTLGLGDIKDIIGEWVTQVDAFYLDGFSPDKNPEMWDVYLFKQCARLAKPHATIATYTVAGTVRRALREAGFIVQKVEGFGGKRHRLTGYYQGFPTTHKRILQKKSVLRWPDKSPESVAVIGAGIAGCSVAERLALRGINVLLFDHHNGPAQQTSSNRSGVIYPLISQDNNRSDRITRAAYLWWQQQRDRWLDYGMIGGFPGVVQLAKSAAHARLQCTAIKKQNWPKEYVDFLERDEASKIIGYSVESPGYWFPQGGWVNPPSLCQAMLASCGEQLTCYWNTDVEAIFPEKEGWAIQSSQGQFYADQLVLANAWESLRLLPDHSLSLKRIFGQVHSLHPEVLPNLKIVLCKESYLVPPSSQYGCMGATFEWEDVKKMTPAEAFDHNADRILSMLPAIQKETLIATELKGNWRTASLDRLPLIGSLESIWGEHGAGLWCLLALGSRGLVWGPWCGEIIASACNGEPLPLERSLYEALSPQRQHKNFL